MDFSALEAYVMVCREGKMSRAAEKLFLSKQTLSMIIKRIESEMGSELLVRTGTGVEMTAEGERFYDYAQRILSLWKACGSELSAMREHGGVRLSVGFGYMVWNFFTREMAQAFERGCPGVSLKAEGGLSRELLGRLDEGRLDMAITCMQSERYAQYDCELLHSMEIWVTMTKEDALAGKPFLTPEDLAGRKLLYPDSGASFLAQFCIFLSEMGIEVQSELMPAGNFLRHLHTIREEGALKLGNGFYNAMVPGMDGFVSMPLRYDGPAQMPRIAVYALMPGGTQRSPEAQRFIEFLARQMDEACQP